jgi:hypothetical protein
VTDGTALGLGSTDVGVVVGGSLETAARLSSMAALAWQAIVTKAMARPSSTNLKTVPLSIHFAFTNMAQRKFRNRAFPDCEKSLLRKRYAACMLIASRNATHRDSKNPVSF